MAFSFARSSPNREMSAPDMNAFSPAPVTTTTRTPSSLAKFCSMSPAAALLAHDHLVGLAHVRLLQTLACRATASNCVRAAKRRNLLRAKAEFPQHFLGMLPELRRRGCDLARRAREQHGLSDDLKRLPC